MLEQSASWRKVLGFEHFKNWNVSNVKSQYAIETICICNRTFDSMKPFITHYSNKINGLGQTFHDISKQPFVLDPFFNLCSIISSIVSFNLYLRRFCLIRKTHEKALALTIEFHGNSMIYLYMRADLSFRSVLSPFLPRVHTSPKHLFYH